MKERPILFSSDMVKAVLDGRKTQTRRIIKPQPIGYRTCWSDDLEAGDTYIEIDGSVWKATESRGRNKRASGELTPVEIKCPYGTIGDRLWVREAWKPALIGVPAYNQQRGIVYKADDKDNVTLRKYLDVNVNQWLKFYHNKKEWQPSIHMPKWAARIWLEKTSNRAPERVQEITAEDCIAEGIEPTGDPLCECWDEAHIAKFKHLWDSLNAKPKRAKHNPYTNAREDCYVGYPWEDIRTEKKLKSGLMEYIVGNPWVWPLDFKRIEL